MNDSSPPPEALFPRLRGGPSRDPERAADHQRARLQGAMVAAVERHGYADTSISELATLAGVSKSTFYERFESKEACFLSTFDVIVDEAVRRVRRAFDSEQGLEGQLHAGVAALAEMCAAEPGAARLVVVESLALGQAALATRERASARFERMLAHSFAQAPERGEISELEIRAIVDGIRMLIFNHLLAGRIERLSELAGRLCTWALCYLRPPGVHALPAELFAPPPASLSDTSSGDETLDWREPPNSARSRELLTQRERIVRAVALVTAERGYASVSIPAISGAAGVSNQTFYANFASKREAFEAAFEALASRALDYITRAYAAGEDWAHSIGLSIDALLRFIAADPLFARFAFVELPASGPAGLASAEQALGAFTALLSGPDAPANGARPEAFVEAIGGGIWGILRHEITAGREGSLPDLGPQIADIALLPFGVREA